MFRVVGTKKFCVLDSFEGENSWKQPQQQEIQEHEVRPIAKDEKEEERTVQHSTKDRKKKIFQIIYDENSYHMASQLSVNERKSQSLSLDKYSDSCSPCTRNPSTLIYGEILYESYDEILSLVLANEDYISNGIFIDLGSGSGKASVITALEGNFQSCIGIEIMSSLHTIASESLKIWNQLPHNSVTRIEFLHGSFLDLSFYDWTNGDVVFANSTCFGTDIMSILSKYAERMKNNSYFITFTYPLDPSSGFEITHELRREMSWGYVDIFIHQKRSSS